MRWDDWYTDTVDIWRGVPKTEGNLTRIARTQIASGVPCRVYASSPRPIAVSQTASKIEQSEKLACDNGVDIRAGDELHIHRGARLGRSLGETRAFAGKPRVHVEPFGAVMPGLAHQEVVLMEEERT